MRLRGVHHINGRKFGRISSTAPTISAVSGKGGGSAMLPNRAAVHELTGQTAGQSALGNYSKLTPTGGGSAFGMGAGFGKMPSLVEDEA